MSKQISLEPRRKIVVFSVVFIIVFQMACVPFMRTKRDSQNPSNPFSANSQPVPGQPAKEFDESSPLDVFRKEIYTLLLAKNFEDIERIAGNARKDKERIRGGHWKIEKIYESVTTIYADFKGQKISDEMWKNRLELLKLWKEKFPDSITSRVAFAKGNMEYGWFVRGAGFSATVSDENSDIFADQLRIVHEELSVAFELEEKCPGWFRESLYLGVADGWSREDFDELFNTAIKFEPNYTDFYQMKALSLTPRWGGHVNEWKKFLDELPGKLATLESDEADIIYFLVAANATNDSSLPISWGSVSTEKIKKGFNDLDKKYQATNYQLNKYAFMMALTMETAAAKEAFERIGDNYDSRIWGEKTFNAMKQMVENPPKIAKK